MLISRKKDKGFQNIITYSIINYLKTSFIDVFSGDTNVFTKCEYTPGNNHIHLDVPITYMYKYDGLDDQVFIAGSTSCVSISIVPVSISHKNITAFGISLDNPTYTVDTDNLVEEVWNKLPDRLGTVPFTISDLTNQIENQFNEIGNKSVSLKNTTKYSRIPRWVDTSKFIPLVFWDTDSYRVRFVRCSDPASLSKWFRPEDYGISMHDTFVHSMVYKLYIEFLFYNTFFYAN